MKNSFLNSKIGIGTYDVSDQIKIDLMIQAASLAKYDFIDTAWFYKNEKQIGIAIKKFKKAFPNKAIPFLQTKIWPDFFKKDLEVELKKSLKALGNLEYIEACLLHRPHVDNSINVLAWKNLIKCQKKSLVKHIGVSNFDPDMIKILYNETKIMPEIIQDELSVSCLRKDRIKYNTKNIVMKQAWRPMGLIQKNIKNSLIIKMSKKYKCTPGQLLIAFAASFGYIPVVKSEKESRINDNIKALKIKLQKKDIEELEAKLNEHESTVSSTSDTYAYLSLSKK